MSLTPPAKPQPTPAQVHQHARGLIAAGRVAQASAVLRKHLYRASRDGTARKLLASLGPEAHPSPTLSAAETKARDRVLAAFHKGDMQTVIAQAEPLLKQQPLLPDVANALANALAGLGRHAEAARVFDHAIRTDPAGLDAYLGLSSLLRTKGQPTEALAAAQAALDMAPGRAASHVAVGLAHMDLDATDKAETHLRRATVLAPGTAATWDALAKTLERLNRLDDLEAVLAEAEGHLPGNPQILLNRVVALGRLGRHEDVLEVEIVPDALSPRDQTVLHVTRARALDATGQHDAAFDAFAAMNDAIGHLPGHGDISAQRYIQRVTDHLAATPALSPVTAPAETAQPVFLVGFPRSGTTLLETILMTDPKVALMEETPLVTILTKGLRSDHLADDLAALSVAEAQARARAYLDAFEKRLGAPLKGRIPVDKMPLNLVEAAAITNCFPGARFVFSLRHPCDVVLSCFMQNFAPSDPMECFRDLDTAATLYTRAMELWQATVDQLALATVTLRYEDLTQDLRGAMTPVLDHIGLEWSDAMARFHETAKPVVRTASYRQVNQPLYQNATGRWRNYRHQLAPVMDQLQPWITKFGYDAD